MTPLRHVVLPRGCAADEATRILGVAAEHAGARLLADPVTGGPERRARIVGGRGVVTATIAPGRVTLDWDPTDRWARLHGPLIADDLRDLVRER